MKSAVIIVEGLIGSGKTHLSTELARALGTDCLLLLEPDEQNNGNPFLKVFYEDQARWAYTMQTCLLALRYRMHLQAQWHALNGQGCAVLDRSFMGDTCFARMLTKSGKMSADEFKTYSLLYQAMTASVLLPNVCIRVLVDPETSQRRIARRIEQREGRAPEKVIDLDYLKALDLEIEHMVGVLRQQGVTVLDVPWDAERDGADQRAQTVKSLAARIRGLQPVDAFLDLHRRST